MSPGGRDAGLGRGRLQGGRGLLLAATLVAVLAVLAVLAAPAVAQDGDGPRYLERLDLPVHSDRIGSPRSVAADVHTGEVFVADLHRDRVVIFGPDGAFRYQIRGGDVFRAPRDVAVDPQGFLYVAANRGGRNAVLHLDFDGLFLGEVELTGLPDDAARPRVASLALSPRGDRLFLLDEENKRLWLAGTDGAVTGSVDLTPGLSDNQVRDLELGHVDVYGDRVLVAMASLGQIYYWDLDGEHRQAVGLSGTAPCQLGFPVAAARDTGGDFLVIDQQRMLISRWSPVGNRCVGEHWGLGGDPGYLYFPFDLALGPEARLYVSQGYQGRVQAYGVAAPAPVPDPEDEAAEAGATSPSR